MSLFGLTKYLSSLREIRDIADAVKGSGGRATLFGTSGSSKTASLASILYLVKRPAVIASGSVSQAERIAFELKTLLPDGESRVCLFPSYDTIPYEKLSPSKNIIGDRLDILNRLEKNEALIVVAPIKALLSRTMPPDVLKKSKIKLKPGAAVDIRRLSEALTAIGYKRVDIVGERSEFSVRGGIIDIFPSTALLPSRIDLLGDEIEAIRQFDPGSQRSISGINEVEVLPGRECIYSDETVAKVKRMRAEDQDADRLRAGEYFEGMEFYLPVFYGGFSSLTDHISDNALFIMDDDVQIKLAARNLLDEAQKIKADEETLMGVKIDLPGEPYLSLDQILRRSDGRSVLNISGVSFMEGSIEKNSFTLNFSPAPDFMMNKDEAVSELRQNSFRRIIVSKQPHRAIEILAEEGIPASFVMHLEEMPPKVVAVDGELTEGFKLFSGDLLLLTDREIFGERSLKVRMAPQAKEGVDSSLLVELKAGDYVVHENHGIGIYRGLERLTFDGVEQEYVLLEYEGSDQLFVPLSQMGLVQKYSQSGEYAPKINKLGGSEWQRAKKKASKSIEDLTADLLDLYSTREVVEGFAFPEDSPWAAEVEAAFPYEETPDQGKAIREVKADMESPKPMDRLVCGDVGYGKTEVALRAAFKAAAAGKQAAVLVPTTILAEQHYENFKERFSAFPVSVEMLSRFRSKEEQKEIVEKVAVGQVDIIIGTHRLLQKDIKFKDLGLLIIDEEQKFGVKSKEKLKKLKKNVDVLSLTATPIPRTLYLSLSGARDMSMIATPPIDRSPVKTYVMEWSKQIVREAILRELERGGQVYYVYNFVEDIEKVAKLVQELIPSARVAVAHGQMPEGHLERTMIEFMNKKFDILVCTTIIESGIDISSVNTIVIDHASSFGLAQLYQLRGRVGRSSVRAYAYLLFRKEDLFKGAAVERLVAIREFTALGSGYKLALRDLEIRGAGNLLGKEQHGHILSLGFDLYCDLMEKAVLAAKGHLPVYSKEIVVDIKLNAYIPSDYIRDERQRIAYYRRMNILAELKDVSDMKDELEDRFGKLPKPVEDLLKIIELKVAAKAAGIKKIEEKDSLFHMEFFDMPDEKKIYKALSKIAGGIKISGKAVIFSLAGKEKIRLLERLISSLS